MDKQTKSILERSAATLAWTLPLVLAACSGSSGGGSTTSDLSGKGARLTAACLAPDASVPDDGWVCSEDRVVQCNGGNVDVGTIYVVQSDQLSCVGDTLVVSDAGPFSSGTHTISVSNAAGDPLCTSQLTVQDNVAPILEPHTSFLWPPNHKFHSISVDECVLAHDACDGDLHGEFIWASSDEPLDDIGDGHFAPDIRIDDCEHIALRAERQGPKDGRVYRLGVRVTDRAGNSVEGECQVIVDHDQRGVDGVQSAEAYRITLDGTAGQLECGIGDGDEDAGVPNDGTAGTSGSAGTGAAGTGTAGTGAAGVGAAGAGAADGGGPI